MCPMNVINYGSVRSHCEDGRIVFFMYKSQFLCCLLSRKVVFHFGDKGISSRPPSNHNGPFLPEVVTLLIHHRHWFNVKKSVSKTLLCNTSIWILVKNHLTTASKPFILVSLYVSGFHDQLFNALFKFCAIVAFIETACINRFLSQARVRHNRKFSGWSLHLVLQSFCNTSNSIEKQKRQQKKSSVATARVCVN